MTMPVDAAKQWSLLDPGEGEPVAEVARRAPPGPPMWDRDLAAPPRLISLRPAQMEHDAPSNMFDISEIEPDEFGPTERPGEADQKERLVSHVDGAVAHATQHLKQIIPLQRLRLALSHAFGPPYPLHDRPDDLGATGIIEA